MKTLFEQQGVQYELQGDYKLPCVALPNERNFEIGVWGERHRRYLNRHKEKGCNPICEVTPHFLKYFLIHPEHFH